jgi:DNA-binding response OmpR family regulator/signal transduction histidine kinase
VSDLPSPGDGPAAFVTGAAQVSAVGSVTAARHGARIVVADANVETRDYIVRLFGEGWRVEAVSDGLQALEAVRREPPDLMLADATMSGCNGVSLLGALRADPRTRSLPVILLSARAGEEARLQALEAGADDCLVKPFAARELLARVEGILALSRVRGEAQAALRASEERYRAFIELTSEAVWRVEMEEPVAISLPADEQVEQFYRHAYLAECNDAMAHMYGYGAAAELVGARLGDLLPQSDPANLQYLRAFVETGYRLTEAETNEVGRDGRPRYFINNLFGIAQDGRLVRAWGSQRDVTERHLSLERLQQAQRMESVGKLAGGIAHEVNNMMSVVLGCSEFVLGRADLPPAVRADVKLMREAAERSAAMTAQLLAFSRRQVLQPVPLDLNTVVRDLEPVLRRTLGDAVALELRLAPLGAVLADRGQLQQVLLNLVLNARDAMPHGGRVVVETAPVELGEGEAALHPEVGLRAGPFAMLAMSDTGHGMDRETASHVFEPFFTTKEIGKGTGLGLSTVYGIVKQSDGYVWVESEPGRGTTLRIYLPLTEVPLPARNAPADRLTATGTETVLVAEDEPMVRAMAIRVLEEAGYTVLAVESGEAALRVFEEQHERVRLVLTDVTMVGVDGLELGRRLAEMRPGLPVLYMSGHPVDETTRRGLHHGHDFIAKPFAPAVLVEVVRLLLDSAGRVEPPARVAP